MKKTYLTPEVEKTQWFNLNAIFCGSDDGTQPGEGAGTGGITPSGGAPRHL